MNKFRKYPTVTKVKGSERATWITTSKICYSSRLFKEKIEKEGDEAFIYGYEKLRKDKEICLYAASKGATIDTLYNFGILDDQIIIESLKASLSGKNNVNFGEQVGKLFDVYTITPELFEKIIDTCEPGTEFSYEIARSSVKNRDIKSYIAHNKEMAMKCVQKDPTFYNLLDPELQNDPEIKEAVTKFEDSKDIFYAIDGTPFSTMEEAAAYNESLGHEMKLK